MFNTSELDFLQVYETYQPRILRYLIRLVGADEAEDLAQVVFMRVNQSLASFRGESQFSTWLYRIATNTAIDKLRTTSFRQSEQAAALDDSYESETKEVWSGEEPASLEQILLQRERLECFVRFVKSLPLNYQIIILLSEIENLTSAEIAAILGLTQETVKIHLHRGRTRLLRALRENCRPEEWL